VKKLYFILETKGSENPADRRNSENLKIFCGKQHFKALENEIQFYTTKSWDRFKTKI